MFSAMPVLGKPATDFGKISHRLWENLPQTLGKPATDFGKISHRLWENLPPVLWSSVLGKNRFRFWEKHAPFFGKNKLRFWDKLVRFGGTLVRFGGNWFGFWIGLGQSSSLAVLNAKHVWVWIFEGLGLGVTKNKSTGGVGRVKCSNL